MLPLIDHWDIMKAVVEVEDGILVGIEVSPKSRKFEVVGYNPWRKRIEIKIQAAPKKGRANKEIIEELSKLTKSHVEIVSGLKSRYKILKIYKMGKNEFLETLDI